MENLKSKIFWTNIIGAIVAIAAVFGIAPEMTGKTAEIVAAVVALLTIAFRLFANHKNTE